MECLSIDYILNSLVIICFLFVVYGLYVIIITRINIDKIGSEYLTDTVVEEINKRNLEVIESLERNLKTTSIMYIDSEFNKVNNRLNKRIKRLIEDKK